MIIPCFAFADSASSTIIMDIESGRILYSNNIHNQRLIASITKIMTCIIVLENNNLDKEITIGKEILSMYGTNIYLEVGEKIKIKDLLYGLMLRSGNDAAITLAINTFGSEEKFVAKMNEKAKQLGMNDTIFLNPHGLDEKTKNYSTAYDMAILSRYAYKNSIYRKIISTKKYNAKSSIKSYLWYNRMSLLNNYKYCVGGKNGYTPSAGKTLVSIAKKNNIVLTIVSLNDNDLYNNHKKLYNKFINNYNLYTIIDKNNFKISSNFSKEQLYIKNSFRYPLTKDELEDVSTFVKLSNITKDNIIGNIIIKLKEEEIGNIKIYRKKKKEEPNLFKKTINLFLRKSKEIN